MTSPYPSRSDVRKARARSSRNRPTRFLARLAAFCDAVAAGLKRAGVPARAALATLPTVLAALRGAVVGALVAAPPAVLRAVAGALRAAPSVVHDLPARMHALELRRTLLARARSARFPRSRRSFVITAGVIVLSLGVIAAAVPRGPTEAERIDAFVVANAQSLSVSPSVLESVVTRDAFSATPGIATYVAGGTNHDWAKLVMLFAGFPITESNVTVFTRWMRQENGSDDWFNRNNPLNNGWGSGGGGGLGNYDNLVIAAENAADALHSVGGYRAIVDAFYASAPTEVIEAAIWASPWASGHYNNGGHWSYAPVPIVPAPEGTWG